MVFKLIKSKKLSKFKKITHGFFGSKGGVSKGIYQSLNCGVGSNDKKRNVKKNLNIVLKKFGSEEKKIFLPKQFHSNKFYYLNHNSKLNRVKCDAVITDKKKIPIGATKEIRSKKMNELYLFFLQYNNVPIITPIKPP